MRGSVYVWATSAPGQGFGFGQLFSLSVPEVVCELGCGAGTPGSPSSGGSGEMAAALLSSSMGVGLALMGGGDCAFSLAGTQCSRALD